MTVTHSGSTKKYSENFSRAFGRKKPKAAAAKSQGKQAGKKKAGKKKAK